MPACTDILVMTCIPLLFLLVQARQLVEIPNASNGIHTCANGQGNLCRIQIPTLPASGT